MQSQLSWQLVPGFLPYDCHALSPLSTNALKIVFKKKKGRKWYFSSPVAYNVVTSNPSKFLMEQKHQWSC